MDKELYKILKKLISQARTLHTVLESAFLIPLVLDTQRKLWSLGSLSCSVWREGDEDKAISSCSCAFLTKRGSQGTQQWWQEEAQSEVLQFKNQPPVLATPLGRAAECRFLPQQNSFLICPQLLCLPFRECNKMQILAGSADGIKRCFFSCSCHQMASL